MNFYSQKIYRNAWDGVFIAQLLGVDKSLAFGMFQRISKKKKTISKKEIFRFISNLISFSTQNVDYYYDYWKYSKPNRIGMSYNMFLLISRKSA